MKLLIIQLSDLHATGKEDSTSEKISKAIDAIRANGKFDKAVVVFSGDIASSGGVNEYKAVRKILGAFFSKLRITSHCSFIECYAVPGNHDLLLSDTDRDIKVMENWALHDHVDEELKRLSSFFAFSNSHNCFRDNKLIDEKEFNLNNKVVQFVLLNSALFSTRKKEDKQVHYLPPEALEMINADTSADLRIAVMHHSFEWFEWTTKTKLKKELAQFDLVMFGHDHVPERISVVSETSGTLELLKGGEMTLPIAEDASFNTVCYDTETNQITSFEYNWNIAEKIFTTREIDKKEIKKPEIAPKPEYINNLLLDPQQLSETISDYYVFPKLFQRDGSFSDNTQIITDETGFFSFLGQNRLVGITGTNNCGKSTILKILYAKSVNNGFLPLFIERRNYDSRIEKMLQDLFADQYGEIPLGFEKFMQEPDKTRIFFIDDFDLIQSEKARSNLISYILDHGGVLVYSTKNWVQNDLVDVVKEKIQESTSCLFELLPFYKEKRDELVSRIFNTYGDPRRESADIVITALDYLAQCQANLFSLTPEYLIQFIKYYLNTESHTGKGRETLTVIFEANIRNAIIKQTKAENVAIYLSALEYIAYDMYFSKRAEVVPIAELQTIINSFNTNRRCNIQVKPFINSCIKAGIMTELPEEYSCSFASKNTYAYFVAKRINAALEKNPGNLADIQFVLNHICFGINDTIVLFLSTLRNNTAIILRIANEADALLSCYPELDFDANNLPLLKIYRPSKQQLPSQEEKRKVTENTEAVEKQCQESVKYRGIFDYNEEDVEKDGYRIRRAYKYLQIVSRALVDQYGSLEASEITSIVTAIYHLTPKVIYASLKPYQDNYDAIIEELKRFTDQSHTGKKYTVEELRKLFSLSAINYMLNTMNDIAYNAATCNTIQVLNEIDLVNGNHLLQNLMMYDNSGDSSAFVHRTVELMRQVTGNAFLSHLISRVARKHIVYTPGISHALVDKLISGKVLSPKSKKTLLIEQRKRDQKKK